MSTRRLALLALLSGAIALVAACGGGGSPSPSVTPAGSADSTGSASAGPPTGEIDHATGATDVILRLEEGGGFVPMGYLVSQAPTFSLYGDGAVVFRNQFAEPLPPGPVIRDVPFRTARLSEEQVQGLLQFALVDGGLGIARASYENPMIADAGTSIFTINAGGLEKVVSVYALGLETPDGTDAGARTAFNRLAERLRDFDEGGSIETQVYVPDRYRGVLYDAFGGADPVAWPWPDIEPAQFVARNDPELPASSFPSRVMTLDEVAALELDDIEGGLQGLILALPDGSQFSLALRPLLPDEEA
jgi:hypothetical protein